MAESTPITVRVDNAVRDRAQGILETLGLTLPTYLNMAVHQLANQGAVPFELVVGPQEAEAPGRVRAQGPKLLAEPAALLKAALAEGDAEARERAYSTIWEIAEAAVPARAESPELMLYENGARGILAATMAYLCAETDGDHGIADAARALSRTEDLAAVAEWVSTQAEHSPHPLHWLRCINAGGGAYLPRFASLAAKVVSGPRR